MPSKSSKIFSIGDPESLNPLPKGVPPGWHFDPNSGSYVPPKKKKKFGIDMLWDDGIHDDDGSGGLMPKKKGNQVDTSEFDGIDEEPKSKKSKGNVVNDLIDKTGRTTSSQSAKNGKQSLNTDSSIVDFLKSQGEDSSYDHRKSLAETYDYGDDGEYKGSAKQNSKLLSFLKSKAPKVGPKDVTPKVEPEATPEEDNSGDLEASVLKQNINDVKDQHLSDGSWDDYMDYVRDNDGADDVMSFSEWKRQKDNGLV